MQFLHAVYTSHVTLLKVQNYTIKGIVLIQNKLTRPLINADDKESCVTFLMSCVTRF